MTASALRFWTKVSKESEGGCWDWMRATNNSGYGWFKVDGRSVAAHRWEVRPDGRRRRHCRTCTRESHRRARSQRWGDPIEDAS